MSEGTGQVDPTRLPVEQAAKLLAAAYRERIDPEKIRLDIQSGAPVNADARSTLCNTARGKQRRWDVASDPRKLKPSELCRLLNSTPLGEVISERQLYRHRQRAGARIGDNKTVDLLRYCAWMHVVRHTPRTSNVGDPYEAMKERARARNAALALAGRDIGELQRSIT